MPPHESAPAGPIVAPELVTVLLDELGRADTAMPAKPFGSLSARAELPSAIDYGAGRAAPAAETAAAELLPVEPGSRV
jgi:hypothetical protein